MKVGDLVRYTPNGVVINYWKDWCGLIIRCIPGTDERKAVMWNKDNNVRTLTKREDLEVINESR